MVVVRRYHPEVVLQGPSDPVAGQEVPDPVVPLVVGLLVASSMVHLAWGSLVVAGS